MGAAGSGRGRVHYCMSWDLGRHTQGSRPGRTKKSAPIMGSASGRGASRSAASLRYATDVTYATHLSRRAAETAGRLRTSTR